MSLSLHIMHKYQKPNPASHLMLYYKGSGYSGQLLLGAMLQFLWSVFIYKGNVYLKLAVQNLHILLLETFFTLVSTYQNTTCLQNIFAVENFIFS